MIKRQKEVRYVPRFVLLRFKHLYSTELGMLDTVEIFDVMDGEWLEGIQYLLNYSCNKITRTSIQISRRY